MKKLPRLPIRGAAAALTLLLCAHGAHAANVAPPGDFSTWSCTGSCQALPAEGDIVPSPYGHALYGALSTFGSEALGVSPLSLGADSRGSETNGTRIVSGVFGAAAGDSLDIQFNYISTDGKGFDDYAWARLLNAADGSLVAWLFTARSSNSSTGNIVPGDVVTKKEFDPRDTIVNYADYVFTSKPSSDPVNWSPLGVSNGTCWRDNASGCGYTGWLLSRHSFAAAGSYRVEIGVINWGDSAFDSGLAFDLPNLTVAVPEPTSASLWLAGLALGGWAALRRGTRSR